MGSVTDAEAAAGGLSMRSSPDTLGGRRRLEHWSAFQNTSAGRLNEEALAGTVGICAFLCALFVGMAGNQEEACPTEEGEIPATIVGSGLILGTDDSDVIAGSPDRDFIFARDGDDYVCGHGGNDFIFGGRGNDVLLGAVGEGNPPFASQGSADTLFGGPGDDVLLGFSGPDRLFGEDGDDEITGFGGNDYISGGRGDDTVLGGPHDDFVLGGEGDDTLWGNFGSQPVRCSTSAREPAELRRRRFSRRVDHKTAEGEAGSCPQRQVPDPREDLRSTAPEVWHLHVTSGSGPPRTRHEEGALRGSAER